MAKIPQTTLLTFYKIRLFSVFFRFTLVILTKTTRAKKRRTYVPVTIRKLFPLLLSVNLFI